MKKLMLVIMAGLLLAAGTSLAFASPAQAWDCDVYYSPKDWNMVRPGGPIWNTGYSDGHGWNHCDRNQTNNRGINVINETFMHFDGYMPDYYGNPYGVCRYVGTRVEVDTNWLTSRLNTSIQFWQGDGSGGCYLDRPFLVWIADIVVAAVYSPTNWNVDDPGWVNNNAVLTTCQNSQNGRNVTGMQINCIRPWTSIQSDNRVPIGFYDARMMYNIIPTERGGGVNGGFTTWKTWVGPVY